MASEQLTREQIGERYLDGLQYPPYPVQEEALLAWMTADQGILLCAPTGTGKTLVAHAALFEALHLGQTAYYTTPLIALSEQKFHELQERAVAWGFQADDIGLVTGNRRVNPKAKVLVVVAEILLNRLLNPTAFDFSDVSAVVMDEFHSFNDPERGIVWELSLAMLPATVRLMLLSATVGNSKDFLWWLEKSHGRKLDLVESSDRKIPLTYKWVADKFLNELVEEMAQGDAEHKKTPALVFCFNREECWTVAEQLKGLDLLNPAQREQLRAQLADLDWTQGVGPKIKQMLWRGVGVHHAGMLPRYRRLVERLYEQKLLSVCVCTETLAAGINLPARSVVLSQLLKGPFGKMKLISPSSAHQIFGRAGRPQFDDRGYVFSVAHEDDVRILRWQEKYDSIPEGTKDPGLMKAKKAMWKKRPTRRDNQQYWNQPQFEKLVASPPEKLASRGGLPWRLLAYWLKRSPEVEKIRAVLRKRLMEPKQLQGSETALHRMLTTLWAGGFITLDPPPPTEQEIAEKREQKPEEPKGSRMFEQLAGTGTKPSLTPHKAAEEDKPEPYRPMLATPTPKLDKLLVFRSVHPLYAAFLLDHLGIADRNERIQALESVLELPRPILRHVRVPLPEEMPPGPMTTERIDPELISRGLMVAKPTQLPDDEEEDEFEEEEGPPPLADKLKMLFEAMFPGVNDVRTQPVWAAGELLRYDGDFNKYVRTNDLVKQEGIIFRHLLRLILLCGEFAILCPEGTTIEEWRADLRDLAGQLTAICRRVDPQSTEKMMQEAGAADLTEGLLEAADVDAEVEAIPVHDFSDPSASAEPSPEAWKAEWERQWDSLLESLLPENSGQ